jgi:SPP1 gp7 family putative phage head morphogenesis protein
MADIAHEQTDALLLDCEKRIAREYRQAVADVQAKLDDYMRRFQIKDDIWRRRVAAGEVSAKEYEQWRIGQIMVGQRWTEMRDTLAEDMHNANVIARSTVYGFSPEAYALNHNYATFQVEKAGLVDTSYSLYDRQTVERLMRDNPDVLPPPSPINKWGDKTWQVGQIQSITMQSIMQGESIPNMTKRIANTLGEVNRKSTIRYARTAITGAQNAGRQDAYKRAENMGIKLKKEWLATLDNRTRHEHRMLDGQQVAVDEPFKVDGYEIMFPGDPEAEGFLVWNCRCTTVAAVDGWEDISGQLRSYEAIGDMSYDEWLEAKPVSRSITHQEEVGEAMRRSYIKELYRI